MFSQKDRESKGVTAEIRIDRCYGCGAILQSKNPMEQGYVKKEKLEQENADLLCERCYRLRHYGEVKDSAPNFNNDYIKILEEAEKTKSLVVYVLDCVFIQSGFIKELYPYLKNCLVVLNKKDILPPDFPEEKLVNKIKTKLESEGVNPLDILLVSTQKNINMDLLMGKINTYRNNSHVYFVGVNNVGKSTIVNKILKNYKNNTSHMITTSRYPGTTLGVISIPLDANSYMFDTPGIFNPNSMTNQVDKSALRYILPREQIKTRNYQLNDEQSLILGGVARFDFVERDENDSEKKSNFTLFLSNEVDVTRCKLAKNKADNTFTSLILQKQVNPLTQSIKEIRDLEKHDFVLPETNDDQNVSITIVGFASIFVQGKKQKVSVYVPKNVKVILEVINYRS